MVDFIGTRAGMLKFAVCGICETIVVEICADDENAAEDALISASDNYDEYSGEDSREYFVNFLHSLGFQATAALA